MANFNYNKVILGGRLTADPELKTTPSGISVASFTVAINRRGKEAAADFVNVTAWRQTAEFITRYFRKGSSICVTGSLRTRSWTDQRTGQARWATDVEAEDACFVDALDEAPPELQYASRNRGQVEVDPTAEVLQGAEAEPGKKPAPGVYSTPDARAGIREGMAEGEAELPF